MIRTTPDLLTPGDPGGTPLAGSMSASRQEYAPRERSLLIGPHSNRFATFRRAADAVASIARSTFSYLAGSIILNTMSHRRLSTVDQGPGAALLRICL